MLLKEFLGAALLSAVSGFHGLGFQLSGEN